MPAILTFPQDLNDKAWQATAASVAAKGGPADLRAKLVAMANAFANPTFALALDPVTAVGKIADPPAYDKARADLGKVLVDNVKKVDAAAKEVEKTIAAARKPLAKDKPLLTQLDLLAKAVTTFRKNLAGVPATGSKAMKTAFAKNVNDSKTGRYLASGVAASTEKCRVDVIAKIKRVIAAGTFASIAAEFGNDGPHRTLPTSCKMWDQLFQPEAPGLTQSILPGKAMVDYAGLAWLSEVANEVDGNATTKVRQLAVGSTEAAAVAQFCREYGQSVVAYKTFTAALAKLDKAIKAYR